MAAVAQSAAGTTIAVDKLNTAITYVPIGQVTSITGVDGGETGKANTTHLSSTRKTSRATIPGETEVQFEINYDPSDAEHLYIFGLRISGVVHGWKVTYPQVSGAPEAVFQAWVQNVEGIDATGVDENLTATVTLCVTSDVTWTP